MKVFISADMEGVTGVAHWDQVTHTHRDYPRCRRQMNREVSAACEGALAAGAERVLVKDAHATARNLDGAELPAGVELISGWSGHPLCMIQELDASFDAALFVGYHSLAGWGGNPLAHTLSSRKIAAMRLNGVPTSEYLLHAYGAELFEVPVVFVSGDEELCAHVAEHAPDCRTVATLRGVGASVVSRHPDETVAAIRDTVQQALGGELASCRLPRQESYRLEVDFKRPTDAYAKSFYPGAEQAGPATVAFQSGDYFEVLRALRFLL